jgi:hypothetical protein
LNPLKDLSKWLFVPSAVAVNEFVDTAQEKVQNGSNVFTYPLELVVRFLMAVAELGNGDCILIIPRIEFQGHLLYPGYTFNFTDYVEQSQFSYLYNIYLKVTDFVLIVALINLSVRKWDEFMTGGI